FGACCSRDVSDLHSFPTRRSSDLDFVGTTVTLDGSQSSDVDGDPLTYRWALTVVPAGSAATLSDPTTVHPTFVVDQGGTYVAQLDRKSTRLNSSHQIISYAVFCLK